MILGSSFQVVSFIRFSFGFGWNFILELLAQCDRIIDVNVLGFKALLFLKLLNIRKAPGISQVVTVGMQVSPEGSFFPTIKQKLHRRSNSTELTAQQYRNISQASKKWAKCYERSNLVPELLEANNKIHRLVQQPGSK